MNNSDHFSKTQNGLKKVRTIRPSESEVMHIYSRFQTLQAFYNHWLEVTDITPTATQDPLW